MGYEKLIALLPLAYIVWWFYALLIWVIPILSTPFGSINWQTFSIWSIVSVILFFTGGIIMLIICAIVLLAILAD